MSSVESYWKNILYDVFNYYPKYQLLLENLAKKYGKAEDKTIQEDIGNILTTYLKFTEQSFISLKSIRKQPSLSLKKEVIELTQDEFPILPTNSMDLNTQLINSVLTKDALNEVNAEVDLNDQNNRCTKQNEDKYDSDETYFSENGSINSDNTDIIDDKIFREAEDDDTQIKADELSNEGACDPSDDCIIHSSDSTIINLENQKSEEAGNVVNDMDCIEVDDNINDDVYNDSTVLNFHKESSELAENTVKDDININDNEICTDEDSDKTESFNITDCDIINSTENISNEPNDVIEDNEVIKYIPNEDEEILNNLQLSEDSDLLSDIDACSDVDTSDSFTTDSESTDVDNPQLRIFNTNSQITNKYVNDYMQDNDPQLAVLKTKSQDEEMLETIIAEDDITIGNEEISFEDEDSLDEIMKDEDSLDNLLNVEDDNTTKRLSMKDLNVEISVFEQAITKGALLKGTSINLKKIDEFHRLMRLDTLTLKRKRNNVEGKRNKRRKLTTKKQKNVSESSDTDSDSNTLDIFDEFDEESLNLKNIPKDDINNLLLNSLLNGSVENDKSDEEILSDEDEEKSNEKGKVHKSKKGNTNKKVLEEEELKRKNWKNHPLLNKKLSSTESEDEEVDDNDILAEKHRKRFEKKSKGTENGCLSSESSESDFEISKPHKGTKKRKCFDSDISDFSSDTDSDFVIEDVEKDEDDDDDDDHKKKGRKNIRALISDNTLQPSTRKAKEEEEARSQRLILKQKNLSSFSEEDGLVLDFDEDSNKVLVSVHHELVNRLKPHQKEGVKFMWNSCYESIKRIKEHPGYGCIIAHCMGLGKTFQVVALIHTLFAHAETNTKHVLVVCPLSTVLNWQNEFKIGLKDVPHNINIFLVSDQHRNRLERFYQIENWLKKTGVLLLGYEAFQNLLKCKTKSKNINYKKVLEALVNPGPDLVICDEGHLLKNGKNNRTKALMSISSKRRIILTGTPLQNNLTEYYHMVQFVKPNLLGSFKEFKNRFANPIKNGQWHNSTEFDIKLMKKRTHVLHKLLKSTVQRYEVSELRAYLPDKIDYVIFIKLNKVQVNLYKKYCNALDQRGDVKGKKLFSDFHNMLPIWTHPYLLYLKEKLKLSQPVQEEDTIDLDPEINDNEVLEVNWWKQVTPFDYDRIIDYGPKLKIALAILEKCLKLDDKVLMFSSNLIELDAIEHFLKIIGTPSCKQWIPNETYYRMDGTVTPEKRNYLCNRFNNINNKKTKLFLISTKVGGLGLNLIAANRVILLDVNWNPSYDSQSIFRAYRFGQIKQVFVYRLVSKGTMEEVVYERSVTKQAVASRVVDEMQISRHFKSSDVEQMYRCDVDYNEPRPILKLPNDDVLANIIMQHQEVVNYIEHQSLLENIENEELDEEEMKLAWEEYNKEKENEYNIQNCQKNTPSNLNTQPGQSCMPSASGNQTSLEDIDGDIDIYKYTLPQVIKSILDSGMELDIFSFEDLFKKYTSSKSATTKIQKVAKSTSVVNDLQKSLDQQLIIETKDGHREEILLRDIFLILNQNETRFRKFIKQIIIASRKENLENGNVESDTRCSEKIICIENAPEENDIVDLDNESSQIETNNEDNDIIILEDYDTANKNKTANLQENIIELD